MPRVAARRVSGVPEGTGTVQYDPGSPADGFLIGPLPTDYFGNRFDTRNGSPLSFPGTVTQVSWYQGNLGNVGPGWGVVLAATVGAGLNHTVVATGLAPNAFNAVGVSWTFADAFFAGLLNRVYTGGDPQGPFGSLGLRTETINAQGFHGVKRDIPGVVSTTLPGQNAMVRVSGNVVIPVELMEFGVE
jgi:hypothetical protein